MCMFHVGQKVVCIADYGPLQTSDWCIAFGLALPEKGVVYTVRELDLVHFPDGDYLVGLRLVELVNPRTPLTKSGGPVEEERDIMPDGEPAFDPRDFRPLVQPGTSAGMAVLHRLLLDQPAEVPA